MEYKIIGGTLPAVVLTLQAKESIITQNGAMCWMSANMSMETTTNGGAGKAVGRIFTGERMFQNIYTAEGGPGTIALASSLPGCIRAFNITPGHDILVQKKGFLASEMSVTLSVFVQKNMGTGLFAGEGFIMQRLSGMGIAFVEIDGFVVEYDLQPGQQIIVDTGYIAAMEASCQMSAQQVPGLKNKILGGEGFFNTVVTGPGKVYLQTMPIRHLAAAIQPYIMPKGG